MIEADSMIVRTQSVKIMLFSLDEDVEGAILKDLERERVSAIQIPSVLKVARMVLATFQGVDVSACSRYQGPSTPHVDLAISLAPDRIDARALIYTITYLHGDTPPGRP
jgi:hypothetical protein